jgi:spore maturation protein CgeB
VKILVIGRYYNEGFAGFIAEHLAELGHAVVRFDPGAPHIRGKGRSAFYFNRIRDRLHEMSLELENVLGAERFERRLEKIVGAPQSIDLTIVAYDFLKPREAATLKRLTGAPLALWYPDPVSSFGRHMFVNAPYDFLFFKDPYLVDILRRKVRAPAFYLPECYSPRAHSADQSLPIAAQFKTDICNAGTLYSYRVRFFQQLMDFDFKLWGPPASLWMNVGDLKPRIQNFFVAGQEKVQAFRGAKIVLNNLHPGEHWGTNARTFEIAGAGGFQIVDWRPSLSQLFDIGRELIAFDDIDDLRGKLLHFLNAPDERATIAAAGHARAAREHTYPLRLKLLLDTVAGRAQGYPMPKITPACDTP